MARDVLSGGRRLCRAYGEKRQRVDRSVTNPGNAAALCPPGMGAEATLLRGGRVDDRPHFGYLVRRKASTLRVFTDHVRVWLDIHAIDPVIGNVTLDPLNRRPLPLQNGTGFRGDITEIGSRTSSCADWWSGLRSTRLF
jgi:hypothetical protein